MQELEFDRACRFLDALVVALQRYGVSSSSMESLLGRVAGAVHLQGEFLATPTQVQSILRDEEGRERLHISASNAGNYDMTKLSQLAELISQVESGGMSLDLALDRIRAIDRADSDYGPKLDAMAYALCGLGFGVILGLSWLDVLLAGALSVVSFGMARLVTRSRGLTMALELLVAAVAGTLATLLAIVFPGSNALAVAVCACIYFVPGFGLTLGTVELMSGNTLSGIIGFTRATVTAVKLVVGGLIGSAIVRGWATVPIPNVESGVPHAWTWLFAPVLVLGLSILFRVRRTNLVWPLLAGLLVWFGLQAGSKFGFWEGTFIGAFLLLSGSRLFARVSRLPSAIILLPAVMLLVPGVAALRALYDGQTLGFVEGLRSSSNVLVLIAAIVGGMLLAEGVGSIRKAAVSSVASMRSHSQSGHQ